MSINNNSGNIIKDEDFKPHCVLVKCGGFSSQLEKHIGEKIDGDPLWGSRFDYTNPEAVIQTHLVYLNNGAQIILSNTYQSSVEGFMQHLKLTKEESIQLIQKSVRHAKDARTLYLEMLKQQSNICFDITPLVLASIGPYGAHLHDGSEYDGSYAKRLSKQDLQSWHKIRIDACLKEGVDGLAVETLPCQMEAEAVVEMLLKHYPNVKFWVSFQCKDEHSLAHGEDFATAVLTIWKMIQSKNATDRLYGIGTNCVNPKFVTSLFKSVHENLKDGDTLPPLIVYSNSGEIYDNGHWIGKDECIPLESYVPEWIELGARIIGGCCRVYPDDICRIRKCIEKLKNNN